MHLWLRRSLIAVPLALVTAGLSVPVLAGDGSRPAPRLAAAPSSPGTSWVAPAGTSGTSGISGPTQGHPSPPSRPSPSPSPSPGPVAQAPAPPVTSQLVTTGTSIPAATTVVTPLSGAVTLHSAADGPVTGTLAPTTYGGPTWVPILATSGGWDQVQLPTGPNGSTAWLEAGSVRAASTPWAVAVSLSSRSLTVYDSGRSVGTWPVAVGAPSTPTPVGRTFISGDIAPVGIDSGLGPVIRPLGLHISIPAVMDEFPGGVIAIHGWRDESADPAVFGKAISHGCIRVPAAGLQMIGKIPTGSPVIVQG